MLKRLRLYSQFVKIEHSVFALPMVLAGVFIGWGGWRPPLALRFPWWVELLLIALAAVGARTAGFAFNRMWDRKIDALNPRTATRELPRGAMTMFEAIGVAAVGILIYFIAALLLLGYLGPSIASLPLVIFAIYPFLKRFTPLAHFGVGLSLALAPLAGWLVAVTSYVSTQEPKLLDERFLGLWGRAWHEMAFLVAFTFFWVSGFDIIYSTMDEAFDRAQGLHSIPAKLGSRRALWVSAGLHVAAFVALAMLYVSYFHTPVAGVVLCATGALLFLEQYLASNVDLAFFKINAILSFLVLGFVWAGVSGR